MRRVLILVGVAVGVLLVAAAWLLLPAWDFLVEPVAPDVRDDVNRAIEAASESPEEQARLRLELAALEQEDAGRRSDLRSAIAQVGTALVAGSVAAWGAVAAWRQLQDNRRHAEAARKETDEQLRLSREELRLSQERMAEELGLSREEIVLSRDAQLVDRFTRAVEQLGDENLDVRLGGIYALERTASDSERDLPIVIEVLAAFVRGHSVQRMDVERSGAAPYDALIDEWTRLRSHDDRGGSDDLSRRAPDVQAALTVLGRMTHEQGSIIVDLGATNLQRAELGDADLWGANLGGANLRGANLRDATLKFAYLVRADLLGANLERADLRGANLEHVDLRDAELWAADLRDAKLRAARLGGAKLTAAKLGDACLRSADLEHADLRDVRLGDARADAETKWPDGFDPEAAGVVFVDRED